MAKNNQCVLCKSKHKLPKEFSGKLFDTKLGKLCWLCYTQKHIELTNQGFKERLERQAKKKLDLENKKFNDFIETGKVTPVKSK